MSTLTSYLLLAGCVLLEGASAQELSPVVQTEQGYVRGVESYDKQYYEYMGIPYATVTSRFGTAGPPRSWQGIFEANSDAIECIQFNRTHIVGQEDCLVINVYVPKNVPSNKPLPVLVHIYGGANIYGSNSRISVPPNLFVNQGIIFVTMNFRVGAFGYLCLRVKEAPGNAAMKDQVAALKWVNRNIRAFGGDPGRVTISGHSSGAMATSFQMLSPMSAGLFHQGIINSGSALMGVAVDEYPIEKSKIVARLLGHETESIDEILEVLSNADIYDLVMATEARFMKSDSILPFSVCIEGNIAGEESFLTEIPYDILSSGNYTPVPMINGITDNEGLWISNLLDIKFVDENLEHFMPNQLEKLVAQKIRSFYFKDLPLDQDLGKFVDLISDLWFTYFGRTLSLMHYKTSPFPVYSYMFQYDGGRNYFKQGLQKMYSQMPGASHADDFPYMFPKNLYTAEISEADKLIMDRFVAMLANFVKYGDPTPATSPLLPVKWLPMNATQNNYLVIDSVMSIIDEPFRERMQFWDELYAKYRRTDWGVIPSEVKVQSNSIAVGIVLIIVTFPLVVLKRYPSKH